MEITAGGCQWYKVLEILPCGEKHRTWDEAAMQGLHRTSEDKIYNETEETE